jgi:hypothetical protein
MALRIPPRPLWLSLVNLLFGIAVLLWLSIEDNGWIVTIYGALGSLLLVAHLMFKILQTRQTLTPRSALIVGFLVGASWGASAIILTMLLMLMKTSLHGHLYPDYSFPLIFGMVARLPAWSVAGGLIGLATVMLGLRKT